MFSNFTSTPPSHNARLTPLPLHLSFPTGLSVSLFLFFLISTHFLISFSSLKRKDRPDDPLQEEEYEAGRVICQDCGTGIAFRDEATNEFTMKHWDAHRLAW